MHALDQNEWTAWLSEGDPRVQRALDEVGHWQGRFQEVEKQLLAGHGAVQVELQRASDVHRVDVTRQRALAARDVAGVFKASFGLHDSLEEDGETVTRARALTGKAAHAYEAIETHCQALAQHAEEEERIRGGGR